GFLPRLVARPARELRERLSAVGVGAPRDVLGREELRLRDQPHLRRHRFDHVLLPSPDQPAGRATAAGARCVLHRAAYWAEPPLVRSGSRDGCPLGLLDDTATDGT